MSTQATQFQYSSSKASVLPLIASGRVRLSRCAAKNVSTAVASSVSVNATVTGGDCMSKADASGVAKVTPPVAVLLPDGETSCVALDTAVDTPASACPPGLCFIIWI